MNSKISNSTQNGNLFAAIERCLLICEVSGKLAQVENLYREYQKGCFERSAYGSFLLASRVGFPELPELVRPKDLPKRTFHDMKGRVALLHSIAHIEFNAINLALDAAYRFREMPEEYYADWLLVAVEEVKHFRLLQERLKELGSDYGYLPAHRGLWDMAVQTAGDVLIRMALIPRYLEARGLDVTPQMIGKFESVGDQKSSRILKIILNDEVGHVRTGNRWFNFICLERRIDPVSTWFRLIRENLKGPVRGPFNLELRRQADFSDEELKQLLEY